MFRYGHWLRTLVEERFFNESVLLLLLLYSTTCQSGARDSVVGVATCYCLDGPWFGFQWMRDFPDSSRRAPRSTQPPAQWILGFFPAVKAAGAWRWPTTLFYRRDWVWVELYVYLCLSSVPYWHVMGLQKNYHSGKLNYDYIIEI
jgi:hypothetical protein